MMASPDLFGGAEAGALCGPSTLPCATRPSDLSASVAAEVNMRRSLRWDRSVKSIGGTVAHPGLWVARQHKHHSQTPPLHLAPLACLAARQHTTTDSMSVTTVSSVSLRPLHFHIWLVGVPRGTCSGHGVSGVKSDCQTRSHAVEQRGDGRAARPVPSGRSTSGRTTRPAHSIR